MQPDIQDLTARSLKLLGKLGMLSPAERSVVDPYVACLELFLDETRPAPAMTPPSKWFLSKTPRRPAVCNALRSSADGLPRPRKPVSIIGSMNLEMTSMISTDYDIGGDELLSWEDLEQDTEVSEDDRLHIDWENKATSQRSMAAA